MKRRQYSGSRAAILLLTTALNSSATHAAPPKLIVNWPLGWEPTTPASSGPALNVAGSYQPGGREHQLLKLTAINVSAAPNPITGESIKELAGKLRDEASRTATKPRIPLVAFKKAQGYFFTVSDRNYKPGDFRQMVEGVILKSGYLINFTLLTNNAASTESQAALLALDSLDIR